MDYENTFPRFIDKPRLIGIFEMDEFFVAFGVIVFLLGASLALPQLKSIYVMIFSISSGITSAYLYKKFKGNRPEGYTTQILYRKGILAPEDGIKVALISYKYLSKIGRVVPYGFTKILYN